MFPADGKYKDVLKAYKKLFNKINLWNVQELGIRTKDKLIVQTSFSFLISTKTPFKETFNFDRINCCCCFRRNLRIFDFFISSFIITRLFSNFFSTFHSSLFISFITFTYFCSCCQYSIHSFFGLWRIAKALISTLNTLFWLFLLGFPMHNTVFFPKSLYF